MDWILTLQNAGLPATIAAVNEYGKVDAAFSRELTPAEWLLFLSLTDPGAYRKANASKIARAIPLWAIFTQAETEAWYTTNVRTPFTAAATLPLMRAVVGTMITVLWAVIQMELALRDEIMSDLPDNK